MDKRADVWAFGCVLFEMLTGRRVFDAAEVSDVLALVLVKDADLTSLPTDVPPSVRSLLSRCLVKESKDRLRDIGEARVALRGVDTSSSAREQRTTLALSTAVSATAVAQLQIWQRPLPALTGALLVAVSAGLAVWSLTRPAPPAPRPVARFEIPLRAGQDFPGPGRHVVAVSPDGRQIVYTTGDGLALRSLDDVVPALVAGTNGGAREPFFSADGEWIGFYADGQLHKVAASGGAPVTLGDAENVWGANWGADNLILYGQGTAGIWRVPGTGGTPQAVITVEEGEAAHGLRCFPAGSGCCSRSARRMSTHGTRRRS